MVEILGFPKSALLRSVLGQFWKMKKEHAVFPEKPTNCSVFCKILDEERIEPDKNSLEESLLFGDFRQRFSNETSSGLRWLSPACGGYQTALGTYGT